MSTHADPRDGSRRGGLVLRYFPPNRDAAGALGFLPIDVARRVTVLGSITRVPGAPPEVAGLALADGSVVTVLWVGQPSEGDGARASRAAVLCRIAEAGTPVDEAQELDPISALEAGLDVALVGGVVLATGLFDDALESATDAVLFGGEEVPTLDVRDLVARCSPGSVAWTGERELAS